MLHSNANSMKQPYPANVQDTDIQSIAPDSTVAASTLPQAGETPLSSKIIANEDGIVSIDGVVIARLYGEPLFDLPRDLYIPPDALEIFLESFEGPLDLLLYLIRKQNFNVLDIPMLQVTKQYLGYVEQIKNYNLELAAEYLLMAAMLIEIKSRMLLPIKKSDSEEEVDDPRAELVRRLLEYEQIKIAAQHLKEIPTEGRDFLICQASIETPDSKPLPEVSIHDLHQAWMDIFKRANLNAHHTITRENLSVREFMSHILRQLNQHRFLEFSQLFNGIDTHNTPRTVIVVNFIAILELSREALIEITQAQAYAPIYVRLSHVTAETDPT